MSRIGSLTIGAEAEFALRVLGNVRANIRTDAADIKARLAAGRETVDSAARALRSVARNLGETLRSFRDDTRVAHGAAILSDLGVTGAQLAGAVNDLLLHLQTMRLDPAGSRAEVDALCDRLLLECAEADEAGDLAFTRIMKGRVRHGLDGIVFRRREQSWTTAGFNFRATSGYVTDGTDETYCTNDSYPTTRSLTGSGESATFGWSLDVETRDRSVIDRRLSGNNRDDTANAYFRADIPGGGACTVYGAWGDKDTSEATWDYDLRDGTTTVFQTVDGLCGASIRFLDASDVLRTSESDWVNNNAGVARTFVNDLGGGVYALTVLQKVAGLGVAHVKIVKSAPAGPTILRRPSLLGVGY